MTELVLDCVTKRYERGRKTALYNFSAKLTPGVYGILGPNGAGKSTLMNLITAGISPDEGEIAYNGTSIASLGDRYRNILGFMPQQQDVYRDMTARRFLWYMSALKGMPTAAAKERISHLLEIVNLTASADKKLGAFSGGMKQRILIAQSLLNDPELLVLDEPTAGLDPKERIRIRNFISTIAINKIVLLATHVVSDIEYIAKEILLMKEGVLIQKDTPKDILKKLEGKVFEIRVDEDKLQQMNSIYKVSNISTDSDGTWVRVITENPPHKECYRTVKPHLEDVYLLNFE